VSAYPNHISSVSIEKNEVIWNDNEHMIIDDKIQKSFTEKLNNPDLEDQLYMIYSKGDLLIKPPKNYDPGRIRNEKFFKKMYGDSYESVLSNLVYIKWLPNTINQNVLISSVNGIDKKL